MIGAEATLAGVVGLVTAWRATVAVAKGFGLSVVIDVGLAMTMIGLWLVWAFAVVT